MFSNTGISYWSLYFPSLTSIIVCYFIIIICNSWSSRSWSTWDQLRPVLSLLKRNMVIYFRQFFFQFLWRLLNVSLTGICFTRARFVRRWRYFDASLYLLLRSVFWHSLLIVPGEMLLFYVFNHSRVMSYLAYQLFIVSSKTCIRNTRDWEREQWVLIVCNPRCFSQLCKTGFVVDVIKVLLPLNLLSTSFINNLLYVYYFRFSLNLAVRFFTAT